MHFPTQYPPTHPITIPAGNMAFVGRVAAANDVYSLVRNPLTGALYAGLDANFDAQMWTTSVNALPADVGIFSFNKGKGVYHSVNKKNMCMLFFLMFSFFSFCDLSVQIQQLTPVHHKHPSRRPKSLPSAMLCTTPQCRPPLTSTILTWGTAKRSLSSQA